MSQRYLKIIFLFLVSVLNFSFESSAQDINEDSRINLSLRMIGHQVLLSELDSTSRVLPIRKEGDRYRIEFDSDFQFDPTQLVATIDTVVRKTELADAYLVEVEYCDSAAIVYAYASNIQFTSDVIACGGRIQPKACYSILFTILGQDNQLAALQSPEGLISAVDQQSQSRLILLLVPLILAAGLIGLYLKRREKVALDPNLIFIGEYQFDKKNMELTYADNKFELTSKEADLLSLLHSSANTTLERDVILNLVWGDQGDYVGRTLDVFISKLRKKLQADPSIKITNIRGIGYRLVLNEPK
jgi:DNA-binding response OmpR family regulator